MSDLLHRLADRANPLLVRSVRQDLRSRLFTATYLLALGGAALVATAICLLAPQAGGEAGIALFATATTAWALGAWCVAGQSAFAALLRERQDDTWDLVELTGMGPARIVRGVWLAGLIQGAVFGAALAPFMVMGFLLRGVDVGLAFVALIGVPLIAAVAMALAILVATLPQNRATRNGATGLVGLALLGSLGGGLGLIFGGGPELVRELGRDRGAWFIPPFILVGAAWCVVLPLVLAASQISHRAADRSTWPRLCWFGVAGTGVLMFAVVWIIVSSSFGFDLRDMCQMLSVIGVLMTLWSIPLGIGAVAEPWALSIRQEAAITGAPRWRRWLTPITGPGAARGRMAFLAMLSLGLGLSVVGWGLGSLEGDATWFGPPVRTSLLIASYACVFLVLGDVVTRRMLPAAWRTPAVQRVVTVAGILILTAVATVPLAILDGMHGDTVGYLSPVLGLIHTNDPFGRRSTDPWLHPGLWLVLSGGAAAALWLLVEGLRQRITRAEVLARPDDRNPRA
ncbi:MAG: hypothetical protein RLZZ127_989 [Planctomycetota bacterium]|jgi:hypothetical protein